jgi:hypothetical protein
MSGNIEVSINIQIKRTDAPPTPAEGEAVQNREGCFHLVLDAEKSLDIDALEDGLLRTSFPALRSALATHLEEEVKKGRSHASIAS